jgi:hypothetical protein
MPRGYQQDFATKNPIRSVWLDQTAKWLANIISATPWLTVTYNNRSISLSICPQVSDSLEIDDDGALHFVNDLAAPGVMKYYGTDTGGVRHWMGLTEMDVVTDVAISGGQLVKTTRKVWVYTNSLPATTPIDTMTVCS